MTNDPIVEEVRAIRQGLTAKFDFDIGRIMADARQRQASSSVRVVSFQAGPVRTQEVAEPKGIKPAS